ncbi:MAG: IPT/TIG domain-containing protein [Treponema sp.]|nr:IPT/TIG domain-containing protein [Treponema sp.]
MESSGKISYIFRKYPSIRVFCLFCLIGIFLIVLYFLGHQVESVPEIEAIIPPVGSPGDVILINGKNFGDNRDMSYVSFSGSKLTASSYISWSDNSIKIVLPANVQDGLVVVGTKKNQSKPVLFANEVDIPVPVPSTQQSLNPVITSISTEKLGIGDLLVITGNNFGETRNESKVLFTIDYGNKIRDAQFVNRSLYTENMIPVTEFENGYEYWSNTEIRVRVPDGACTGVVIVQNEKTSSEPFDVSISDDTGIKSFKDKKIYLIQYTADVKDIDTTDNATITLRCPIPVRSSAQPETEVTEMSPAPLLQNYQNCMIYQMTRGANSSLKNNISQTVVLPVYEVNTKVNPDKIGSMKKINTLFYNQTTSADSIVPADDDKLKDLYKKIVGKEKNHYRRAKLIYDYMCDNYEVLKKNRKADADPLDLVSKEKGDAYDFAVIYAALLRTAGIPCIVDSGILIDASLKTRAHWWCEFYLPGYGWIPVDVSLGRGMEYQQWPSIGNDREYYFGNMDSHHIVFSRGFTEMKPFAKENKIVQYQKSFALQSIWEEASSNTIKYSSYWSVPEIKGVY